MSSASRRDLLRPACRGRLGTTAFVYPDRREMISFSAAFRPPSVPLVVRRHRSLLRLAFQDHHGSGVSPNLRGTTKDVCRGPRGICRATVLVGWPTVSDTAADYRHRRLLYRACPDQVESRACLRRWIASRCPSKSCRRRRRPGRVVPSGRRR